MLLFLRVAILQSRSFELVHVTIATSCPRELSAQLAPFLFQADVAKVSV